MPPDAEAADTGILTIDQAVAQMDAADKEQEKAPAEAAAAPEPETPEAAPTAEEASEPETATDGETAEEEPEEAETPQLPAINPPPFWDADAKTRFGELPRDLQELVLAKEAERDKATSTAMEKSAVSRKAAEAEASRIAQLNGVLDKLLPQAEQTLKSRWEGVDWNAVIDQQGAEAALKLQNQMRDEERVVQQLQVAKNEADQVQFVKFVEAETAKLPELAPDLADPKLGNERKQALGTFLISTGVPPTALRNMTANETAIAYDAMRWRNAQADAAKQAANPKPQLKPAAQPQRPSIKGTATPTSRNPQSARLQTLTRKSSLSIDEATELLTLQGE